MLQPRSHQVDSPLDLGHREARPPAKILQCRRTMTREVAEGELGQSLITVQALCSRRTLLQEGVCLLLAARRSAADQAVELRIHQDQAEPQRGGGDLGALKRVRDLFASEVLV